MLPVLAIDLGGTKIITVIINNGQVIAEERCLTLADEGQQSVINRILSTIDHLLKNTDPSQLDSISLAVAGAIDLERGLVTSSPHLPGWHDVQLRDMVREKYRLNTFLLNDASAAALGEHHFGVGRGINNLILLTVGTGIGGGIIINGRLYNGPCGSAGEIGHTTIDVNGPSCECGNIGCLETLEKIGVAARAGDSLALDIIAEAGTCLGVGMVNLVNIFNPEMIVVGGGVAKIGDLLLDPARQVVKERAFQISARAVRIVPAQLGDEAGVLGAAAFALEQPR